MAEGKSARAEGAGPGRESVSGGRTPPFEPEMIRSLFSASVCLVSKAGSLCKGGKRKRRKKRKQVDLKGQQVFIWGKLGTGGLLQRVLS